MSGNQKVLKAIKETISDYASKSPLQLVSALRDPAHVAKMKKLGVDDVQIHRVILYLQQHRPELKVFEALPGRVERKLSRHRPKPCHLPRHGQGGGVS